MVKPGNPRGGLRPWRIACIALTAALSMLLAAVAVPTQAGASSRAAAPKAAARVSPPITAAASPATLARDLGSSWWQSKDLAVTGSGDDGGYHLYIGQGSDGYAWRSLATLQPAGYANDTWVGYQCLTGSGRYVIAVVAPEHFVNSPQLRDAGGVAYAVDVATGRATPVASAVAVKYYSPGCGAGDNAVLTRNLGEDQAITQLLTVNAARGKVTSTITVQGQITSAVPAAGGVVGAQGNAVVRVAANGKTTRLASARGQAFSLVAGTGNDVYFLAAERPVVGVYGIHAKQLQRYGSSGWSSTQLTTGRSGRPVLVNGPVKIPGVVAVKIPAGQALDSVSWLGGVALTHPAKRTTAGDPQLVAQATARVRDSGSFPASARATTGMAPVSATLARALSATAAADSATKVGKKEPSPSVALKAATSTSATVKAAAVATPACAVPRLSPRVQVPQPNGKQVEWAVDQVVRNNLTAAAGFGRPAGFNNMVSNSTSTAMAAYAANSDFGRHALTTSPGVAMPPQVMLGILAQESNLKQASWHALPGVSGDPLIADYYGAAGDVQTINYAAADCGYGIGQVTTNMSVAEGTSVISANGKTKIADDFEENIAEAATILEDKWNQLAAFSPPALANNGDPTMVENWYMAIWAYNTGIHTADSAGEYGLGWTNNPMNADYSPTRAPYLSLTYADAAHPGDWPYQERVMGWMSSPIVDYTGQPAYSAVPNKIHLPVTTDANGLSIVNGALFCTSANACQPSYSNGALSYCTLATRDCWWHSPVSWTTCPSLCTTGSYAYSTTATEPTVTDPHPPDCNSTLPNNAVIVDDLPEPDYNVVGCGTRNWSSQGSFALAQGTDSNGIPLSVIDTHQIGLGFGGHLYFAHNRAVSDAAHLVTGTWKAPLAAGAYHVYAHMPSSGGTATAVHYKITAANGTVFTRTANQYTQQDQWAGLGYYSLGPNAEVDLNNVTDDGGLGTHDVAYDAVAFVPVSGTVKTYSFDAVSIFNTNQNLDTLPPPVGSIKTPMRSMKDLYQWGLDYSYGGAKWNDSTDPPVVGVTMLPKCASNTHSTDCVDPDVWNSANAWHTDVVNAGPTTTGHVNGMTEPDWMSFGIPAPPTAITSTQFAKDDSFKIRTHVDTSFLIDASSRVVPGSQESSVSFRTGTTHLPTFMTSFISALATDYGIAKPNLAFDEVNANTYTGDATHVDPLTASEVPGRAYVGHAAEPAISSNGQCVTTTAVSGGSIAYRVLAGTPSVYNAFAAWAGQADAMAAAGTMPAAVAAEADEINNLFVNYNVGELGTTFEHAAPIWQQLNLAVCADGTISSTANIADADDTPQKGLVEQGFMPDLYLYLNNKMINQTGGAATGPVQNGDFQLFTNVDALTKPTSYGGCDIGSDGNGGNPWLIGPLTEANVQTSVVFYCDGGSSVGDPYPIPMGP